MKIAINWAISIFTAACILFMGGVLIGRLSYSSYDPSENLIAPTRPTISLKEAININTADAAQLQNLPGIGRTLAERIVQYREINGPFETSYQLLNVEGIGEKKLSDIFHLIIVEDIP